MGAKVDIVSWYIYAFLVVFILQIFFTVKTNIYDVSYNYRFSDDGPICIGSMTLSLKNNEADWGDIRNFIHDDLKHENGQDNEALSVVIINVSKRTAIRNWQPFWIKA